MGFNIQKALAKNRERGEHFTPCDLNEGNVQAIFNRCLATDDTPKEQVSRSILFSRTLGYKPEEEIVFSFDKGKLLSNYKNIRYLYGQLRGVHQSTEWLPLDEVWYDYSGKRWTASNACRMYLLYLGCTNETDCISPFRNEVFFKFCDDNDQDGYLKNLCTASEKDTAELAIETIKPTLSPKDPNFPTWWEEHKSEWEA